MEKTGSLGVQCTLVVERRNLQVELVLQLRTRMEWLELFILAAIQL